MQKPTLPNVEKKARTMATKPKIHESSGNIFADVGLPDAENHMLKAQLVTELFRLFTERKLTQTKAAEIMGITQPAVSRLFKGDFRDYSIERLMRMLTAFDQDVQIVASPHAKAGEAGRISFTAQTA